MYYVMNLPVLVLTWRFKSAKMAKYDENNDDWRIDWLMEDNKRRNLKVNDNTIRLIRDILIIEIGLMISSFGTGLFYAAELGSTPMATLCDGIHILLNISYGAAYTLANGVLLIVLFFLEKSYLKAGTFLCVLTIGPWVNVFTPMLQNAGIASGPYGLRLLCTVIGTALMGIGLGLYVAVDRGFGALEGIVKIVSEKSGISMTFAKIIQDAVLIISGILLNATWGVGTLITLLLTGPALQWSVQFFERIIGKKEVPLNM